MNSTIGKKNSEFLEIKGFLATFYPYWPLFLVVVLSALLISTIFIQLAVPSFTITSSILINDESKGSNDARIVNDINPFQSKKIVENEIEILKSKDLIEKVVKELNLSVGIFKKMNSTEWNHTNLSAWLNDVRIYDAPFRILTRRSERNLPAKNKKDSKYYFHIEGDRVHMGKNEFNFNEWIALDDIDVSFIPLGENVNLSPGHYFQVFNESETVEAIAGDISIETTNKLSTVVKLKFSYPDPLMGEKILDKLIEKYYERSTQNRMEVANSTIDFIESRMDTVSKEISDLNFSIERLRIQEGLIDIGEQGKIFLNDVGQYDRQKSEIRTQLAILDRVERYVQDSNGSIPSSVGIDDPNLNILFEKLYNSEIEYERLKKTAGANNPMIKSVELEIENLKPSILENVQNQKMNLTAALENVENNINRSSGSLRRIPFKERQLIELNRQKEVKVNLLNYLMDQKEETTLSSLPDYYRANIVNNPSHSLFPTSPKKAVIYIISVLVALIFCIAYIVRKEYLNNKVLYRSHIESYISLPVIAEIPYINIAKKNRISSKDRMLLDNAFRALGIQLGLYNSAQKCRSIMVTSSIPEEGKSFVSENLARTLSALGKKVVLIDTDFLRPKITQDYGLENNLGVLDFFKGAAELNEIKYPILSNENLMVVTTGRSFKNYLSVLDTKKFEILLEYFKRENDFIIIDSAPVNIVSDYGFFAPYMNNTLLVVRHKFTPETVLENLGKVNILDKLVEPRIVFNYVKNSGVLQKGANYGYQYYNQSHYGVK